MDSIKYIGLDVHQSTISVAALNADGKLVMQSVIATHAATILDFLHGLRGTLHVTFEEGTHSAWLYDLLVRRVTKLVVCNPRKNALLKAGNKSDTIDARKLAELLRVGLLSPVYHGQNSTAAVKHLGRSYAAPPGLRSFSTQRRRSVDVKTTSEPRLYATRHDERGWMSENYLFSSQGTSVFS